jgi:Fic-DOC domain mobile mystery protein B
MISIELKKLCDDVLYWIENNTFAEDEIAARFHHRLVSIHLFPNGNGRHARLITDILLENVLNKPSFTWGNANLAKSGDDRKRYIESLIAADRGEYEKLLEFVRS